MIRRAADLILLVVALTLVAPGCGGDGGGTDGDPVDGDGPAAGIDTEITLEILDGELTGGVRREEAAIGDVVRLVVTGDTAEPVHVHGYDLYVEPDGGEGELVFDALIPGRFEVELEDSGRLLIELTVS